MQNVQMKLQKIIIVGTMVLSALMIFYALGFSTDLYSLSYHLDSSSSLFYVPGAELYREVQPFNRSFFGYTIVLFVLCVAMFMMLTHKRRLYYASNYITSLLWAGFSSYLGLMLYNHAVYYKAKYLEVDFEKLKTVTDMMRMKYVESTFMLDLGIVLSFIMFVVAICVIVNLVLKSIWMSREKWLKEPEVALK